ncbi:c-type cytochrome [Fluviispira vulneris]|uniref:c-type cytochrome n=1 Tax=Fluviispira vulneris TaxID=2763012 RepID=UPI001647F777|nr:cytochrome c [Fluviispira vulneris]
MKAPARVLLISTIVSVLVICVALYRYNLILKGDSSKSPTVDAILPEVTGESANADVGKTPAAKPSDKSEKVNAGGKAPTAKQLENGKKLYAQTTCGVCHGADGKADSPTAKAMKATNLAAGKFQHNKTNLSPVAYIAKVIAEGVPGTGMASFKAQLPKESDRMDLAEYVHSLSGK